MPANLGYISAMLFNQNNCASEVSPVTSRIEVEVGKDLCVMMGYEKEKCMGHLAAGGSVANIEAIWAGRNLKYFPLGLQEALLKDERLADARGYKVFFPQRGEEREIVGASQWELLNIDVDTILKMPSEVEALSKLEHPAFMEVMSKYLYESIGVQAFVRRHMLTQSPCVIVPSTLHISLTKAVTILGLGRESIVTVPVDEDARMDPKELKRTLKEKLEHEIPVITVVAVTGTTEESAVDPVTAIVESRQKFRTKGLNFAIHADAAWGGYFCSMLRAQPGSIEMPTAKQTGFVPEMYLSTYVHDQLSALHHCDTITVDPHKSGFCPYPGGAICYRDRRMNSFLSIATKVLYYHGKMILGDIGIEGSKPGASAVAVMMANRVIGLHKNGYGRILAECMFTSKILYCQWVTLANEDDNFIIKTTKPLPKWKTWTEKEHIKFIRKRILGKSNEELAQDEEAMLYLKEVGPDTMIPCFSVNLKGNQSVELCNAINTAIFKSLSHTSGEHTAQRIPMIVTSSSLVPHEDSAGAKNFKKRLGLQSNNDTPVKYIKTTCMDPWATSIEFMDHMASIMRNSILCAIGTVIDPAALHNFVSTGVVNQQNEVIAYYVGDFNKVPKQYETIVKLKFLSNKDVEKYINMQAKLMKSSVEPQPIVFRSKEQRLHDVFFKDTGYSGELEEFDCFVGLPSDDDDNPFMSANMKIMDVPRYEHFDNHEYLEHSSYFIYGDKDSVFLFHVPTKSPDFLQVVQLDGVPDGAGSEEDDDMLLKHGTEVEIPSIRGAPVVKSGEIQDPLDKSKFDITFVGINGKEVKSKVKIARKIWFASSTNTFSNIISVSDRKGVVCSQKLTNHFNQLYLR